jgi:hypothetical protein
MIELSGGTENCLPGAGYQLPVARYLSHRILMQPAITHELRIKPRQPETGNW